jgi:hypothetical protein
MTTTETDDELRRIRKNVATIELLRAVRPVLDQLGESRYQPPVSVQRALRRWAEATLVHRPPTPTRCDPAADNTDA